MRNGISILTTVAAVALAAPAVAQGQAPEAAQQQQQEVSPEATIEGESLAALPAEELRDLLGSTIRTTAGNEIGTLHGIGAPTEGQAGTVVIRVGGDLADLGAEKEMIHVGADRMTRAPATDELVLNMPMSELEAAPEFLQTFDGAQAAETPGAAGAGATGQPDAEAGQPQQEEGQQ